MVAGRHGRADGFIRGGGRHWNGGLLVWSRSEMLVNEYILEQVGGALDRFHGNGEIEKGPISDWS